MRLYTVIFFLFLSFFVQAQRDGIPFIQNYAPEVYKGFSQNWTAEQDNRGVIYFGNGKGILEYNGKTWRRFFTDKVSTVLSMGKDGHGRIYIGGENEIGYIAPDSTGLTQFYDLTHLIPEEHKGFSYVWHVYANERGVYFVTPEKVIRIKDKDVRVYYPKARYFTAFMVDSNFFIQDTEIGLLIEENDTLVSPPCGQPFGDIRGIFPYDKDRVLFATRNRGCFLFDYKNPAQYFETEAETLLKEYQFYKGVMTYDSLYVFGTITNGLVVMDKQGKVRNVVNDKLGLHGNTTYALYEDKQGGIWCMLGNGISRVDFSSPLTQFDKRNDLVGIVQDIELVNGSIYAAVIGGVYKFTEAKVDETGFHNAKFNLIPEFNDQFFGVANFQEIAMIVGTGGVYTWDGTTKQNLFFYKNEICVETSKYHDNTVFVGGSGLLYALRKEEDKWKSYMLYDGGVEDLYYLAEQNENTIWASTVNDGVLKFEIRKSENFEVNLVAYDTLKGVPTGMTEITSVNNEIYLGSAKGLKKYNKENDRFEVATGLASTLSTNSTYVISEGAKDRLWALREKTVGYSYPDKDTAAWFDYPFRRMLVNDIYKIYPVENGCWIGGTDGIFYYDETKKQKKQDSLNSIITRVQTASDTIFNGAYYYANMFVSDIQPKELISEYEYYHNAFIFEFSLASFNKEEFNYYKYFLEGYDEEWSSWTYENKKEYTNLPEGTYVFKLVGADIYGNEGKVAKFEFTILPPWYRTYWAYALYIISFILIVYVAMRLNSYRLRTANQRLEAIVAQRTQELRERNEEILQQKEEIEAQRDEIEAQRDQVVQQNEAILQQNEEIEAQRDEIESQRDMIVEQKQEIVDSINYASFIQEAILPPKKIITDVFADTLVLFRPKDIVSGDFYWFFEKDNKTYVAAVDCTGHGVPGGFMSMLGIAFLTEIVSNKNISSAAEILNDLRNLVISSLRQSDDAGSSKDGMDMALCIFDKETSEIHYAGANNPLYIVKSENDIASEAKQSHNEKDVIPNMTVTERSRSDEPLLDEIKGDKMPIGIHYFADKEFTNHTIKAEKGDRFYIFSDGFPDQFGGAKGKKFKYKKLKQLLLDTSNKPMTEQEQILNEALDNWMSYSDDTGMPHEQIDDVLIVGFEV